MKVAVVAHYDTEGIWDENFLLMLAVIARMVERVVLVTTTIEMPDLPENLAQIELVRRPNIGYDFYSYRVGLGQVLRDGEIEGVFVLNSSLLLLHSARFGELLRTMADENRISAVRGVTASSQIAWHLQSYLLYFDLRKLPVQWLQDFFSKVQPVNTKFEVVIAYEIGLSKAIIDDRIPVEVMYVLDFRSFCGGTLAWMRKVARSGGRYGWLKLRSWRALGQVNWVHFAAGALAQEFGFVKAEVLRSNPHKLPLDNVLSACEEQLFLGVSQAVERTKKHYAGAGNGLTELAKSQDLSVFNYRHVESRAARHQGAKIAVVVHLYYLDLLEEILSYLENILEPFDLYITTPFEADVWQILNELNQRGQSVTIMLGENRGRDVGPFIALCRSGMLNAYEAVLKLHSKKSRYSDQGSFWRKQLYEPLCGNSLTVLRTLELLRRPGIGVVGPGGYFLSHNNFWGANRDTLAKILISAGVKIPETGPELGFFAGTMFWFAPDALIAIQRIPGTAVAFEPESGKQDGTLAHAWERAFCLLARAAGYGVTALCLSGGDIFTQDNEAKRVPVLTTDA
jgi:rhamnosyltransferase